MTDVRVVRHERLLRRARSGDTRALERLLGELRPLMFHVANRRASDRMPAEDLVSIATLRFIERLSAGAGPTDHPGAYLTTSIRNIAVDEQKSRAASNVSLEVTDEMGEAPHDEPRLELLLELAAVREAFARLPPAQRKVLHDTVIDGRRPRELADEYGVRANAVSAQASRARRSLAIELRFVLLERHGCAAGEEHREELARTGEATSEAAREHLEHCRRCSAALAAFRAIPGVLAVLPFVALGGGAVAGAAGAHLGGDGGSPAVEADGRPRGARRGAAVATVVGAGVVAAAALAAILPGWLSPGETAPEPVAFDVAVAERAGATDLVLDIGASERPVDELRLDVALPSTMTVSAAPDSWECSWSSGGGTCAIPAEDATATLTVQTVDGVADAGDYSLDLGYAAGALDVTASVEGVIVVR